MSYPFKYKLKINTNLVLMLKSHISRAYYVVQLSLKTFPVLQKFLLGYIFESIGSAEARLQ
jgi:hypothetical protein